MVTGMPSKEASDPAGKMTFKVGSSTYELAPDKGFQLMRWTIQTINSTREILHWPSRPDYFDSTVMGGNPLLFPFCGRSYDRGMEGVWRSPNGEQLPMPIHGFARSCPFSITVQSDNSITGSLQPTQSARLAYPFDYEFRASYTFEELAFTVTLSLTNLGPDPIPWSAGHHFFFKVPWHENATHKDYVIKMDPRKCAYHGPDGKLVMEKDRATCHELSESIIRDRIHWQLRHNRIAFGPKGGEEDIHIRIGEELVPQKNVTIVTWSGAEDSPYYCIEPWMGPPNAAEHGKGLHWAGPGETQSFEVEVSLF